jgi:hypothetical protein
VIVTVPAVPVVPPLPAVCVIEPPVPAPVGEPQVTENGAPVPVAVAPPEKIQPALDPEPFDAPHVKLWLPPAAFAALPRPVSMSIVPPWPPDAPPSPA